MDGTIFALYGAFRGATRHQGGSQKTSERRVDLAGGCDGIEVYGQYGLDLLGYRISGDDNGAWHALLFYIGVWHGIGQRECG